MPEQVVETVVVADPVGAVLTLHGAVPRGTGSKYASGMVIQFVEW